jgi:hypothetical protein
MCSKSIARTCQPTENRNGGAVVTPLPLPGKMRRCLTFTRRVRRLASGTSPAGSPWTFAQSADGSPVICCRSPEAATNGVGGPLMAPRPGAGTTTSSRGSEGTAASPGDSRARKHPRHVRGDSPGRSVVAAAAASPYQCACRIDGMLPDAVFQPGEPVARCCPRRSGKGTVLARLAQQPCDRLEGAPVHRPVKLREGCGRRRPARGDDLPRLTPRLRLDPGRLSRTYVSPDS